MMGKAIGEIRLGEGASFTKTLTETDIYLYAGITGDFNPAHVDENYARKTRFKTRIAHGMLTAGFISTILGTRFPGPGTIYIRQELNFLAPVHIGDTITATVEVAEIEREKNRVILKTSCQNQENITVMDGKAIVSPPRPIKES